MKKLFILLVIVSLLQLPSLAQFQLPFSVSNVFPVVIEADPYADAILNTPGILKRAGIKKIRVYRDQYIERGSFTSKTEYINEEGNICKVMLCFAKNKNTDSVFCLTDTFMYDAQHRIIEQVSKDGVGQVVFRSLTEYLNIGEIKNSFIAFPNADTSVTYKYFNEKGQLVRSKHFMKGSPPIDACLYYNADGLIDSIQNKNSYWGTFVFKRREKRKTRQVAMNNTSTHYTWIYNLSGQCITTRLAIRNRLYAPGRQANEYASEIELKYYYNADGTLSKTINKTTGRPTVTMIYTYSK